MRLLQQAYSDEVWKVWLGAARAVSIKRSMPSLPLQDAAVWNQRLSGSILSDIAHVEVALRNVISDFLNRRFCVPEGSLHWLSDETNSLGKIGGIAFRSRVRDAQASASLGGREPSFDDVIAELSLGFWLNFLSGTYQHLHGDLVTVFVGAKNRNLRQMRQVGSRLRNLRNRVAHHHRIIHRDLDVDWRDIVTFANFIDPRLREFLSQNSSTPGLVAQFNQIARAECSSSSHEPG